MLNQNRSRAALIGLGVGAAAATASALYVLRRRAHRAAARDAVLDELGDLSDDPIIAVEFEDIEVPLSVEAELDRLEAFENAEGLGESWIEEIEVTAAENGPEPGRELPIADASRHEPVHHGKH